MPDRTSPVGTAPVAAYLLALLIGCAFVAWLFPAGRLFPSHPLDLAFNGDEAQHVIGQRYFIADAWRWPLLLARQMNAPDGVNIAYTDSIPLVALALKLLRGWLPTGFTMTESWIAVAYALQPVAAVFALRSAGERRLVPALAVAAISLSMPTLLARFGGHEALCSHFVILTAIGLYFRQTTSRPAGARPLRPEWLTQPILLVAALLIHPYLACMAALVLAAVPLCLLLRRDRRWRAAAVSLALAYAAMAATAVLLGYTGAPAAQGFGFYSMNLLGPVAPGRSLLFPAPPLDATGGQSLEGYQYLGAGVLLLAVAALACRSQPAGRPRDSHHGLLVICLLAFGFALSDHIYLGHRLLLAIRHVPSAITQFQATGRFFWPVAYVIVIASVVALGRRLPSRWLTPVLLAAALLQAVDATTLRQSDYGREHYDLPWSIPRAAIWPAFVAARQITLWPTQSCGAATGRDAPFMEILLLASAAGLTTNTMYMSRYPADAACDAAAVLSAPWQPGELRVILPPAGAAARWLVPDAARSCRQVEQIILCREHADSIAGLPFPVATLMPLGEMLPAASPAVAAALASGWSPPGRDGAWSTQANAVIIVQFAPGRLAGGPAPSRLTIHGTALAPHAGGIQRVEVTSGGAVLATWDMPDGQPGTWTAELPPGSAGLNGGPLEITLHIHDPTRYSDRGLGPDNRRLGLLLDAMAIE